MEHRFARVGGIRLHVVEAGPVDGPLLLLLHGFPEFWYGWRKQIDFFAEAGYRVLVPDQRGYNLSDKPRRVAAYGLDRLSEDVAGLVAEAGRDSAFIVGHDWGGLVGWWVAVRFPELVRKLGVLNVPHPRVFHRAVWRDPAQRKRSWYIFYFQLPWLPERWYRRNDWEIGVRSVRRTARPGAFTDEEMEAYRRAWSRPGAIRSMIHWYRAAVRKPAGRVSGGARVTVPTLILWGERDRFLGKDLVQPSLDLCDDGRVVFLPEATHWVQHEEPDRVNGELLEFLGG